MSDTCSIAAGTSLQSLCPVNVARMDENRPQTDEGMYKLLRRDQMLRHTYQVPKRFVQPIKIDKVMHTQRTRRSR
jgi:hypothetical protein